MTLAGGGIAFLAESSARIQAATGALGGLDAVLSRRERDASVRFRRPADRLDYAASHALFRLVAAWGLGLSPDDATGLEVRRTCGNCGSTQHGKPAVDGVGLSLSRSHGIVMTAVGPAGSALGADIEKIPAEISPGFDGFALAPEERPAAAGPGFPETSPSDTGFSDTDRIRLWVAKEAVLKAAGLGLAIDPSAVWLVPAGGGLLRAESPGNPMVHGLLAGAVAAPKGYAAAVATNSTANCSVNDAKADWKFLPARELSFAEIFATKG